MKHDRSITINLLDLLSIADDAATGDETMAMEYSGHLDSFNRILITVFDLAGVVSDEEINAYSEDVYGGDEVADKISRWRDMCGGKA